jgi:hypothetical protein
MRAALLVLALAGCATVNGRLTLRPTWWPEEEHGGTSGRKPASDWYFVAAGATFDAGMHVLHVKPIPRALADVTAAVLMRTWRPLGRTESSGLTFSIGASAAALTDFVLSRHRSR